MLRQRRERDMRLIHPRRPRSRAWLPYGLTVLLLAPVHAAAQVACTSPDALCTGDPCVIRTVDVADPCVVDFGARTVVVAGTVRLPTNGTLSLTGGAIQVPGSIRNLPNPQNVGGAGPRVELTATGDVEVTGSLRLNGRVLRSLGAPVPGSFVVDAGGALRMRGSLRTSTAPTVVELSAASAVDFGARIVAAPPGSTIAIAAGDRVDLGGSLRGFERIAVDAGTGVDLTGSFRFSDLLSVDAGGVVTLATAIRILNGHLTLRGASGVDVRGRVYLLAIYQPGGSAEFTSAAGPVAIDAQVNAEHITVTADGDVAVRAPLAGNQLLGPGGSVVITSLSGSVLADAALTALPGDGTRPGDGAGGDVHVTAADAIVVRDDLLVDSFLRTDGAPGGTVRLEAASIEVGPGVTVNADGDPPGPDFAHRPPAGLRFVATAGDLVLDGTFRARRAPTTIEGTASGNLTARGRFEAAPSGCIALAAGGTLDLAGATFDTPPVGACP
jgi:hypothetical protein